MTTPRTRTVSGALVLLLTALATALVLTPAPATAGSVSAGQVSAGQVAGDQGMAVWTKDFSHGEPVREGADQNLIVDPCRLRFLHQGMDPAASGDYSQLPRRLSLVTRTNSAC